MLKSLTLNVSVNNFKLFQIQPKEILYITFKLHIGLEIDIAWFTTFLMHINKHNMLDSEKKHMLTSFVSPLFNATYQ